MVAMVAVAVAVAVVVAAGHIARYSRQHMAT